MHESLPFKTAAQRFNLGSEYVTGLLIILRQ